MQFRIHQGTLHGACLGLASALTCCAVLACQGSADSREPVKEPPAASAATAHAPAAAAPATAAAPAPAAAAQTTQPLQGAAPAAPTGDAPAAKPEAATAKPGAAASTVAAAQGTKGSEGKAAPAGPAKSVQGTVVSEDAFSAFLQAQSPAKAGAPVQLEAVLVAKPPYHCNAEYPHKFKLNAAPAGLSYPEETVKGMKVTPERSVLAIPVNAQSAGKPTVSGTLSFSVCTDERCMVEKRDLSLALDVM